MNQEAGELCRLLVVGPTSQVEVSLPTHIPLADMMPALLSALGPDLADRGLEHSGWIAQRLGGPALDESSTVGDLELLDGEVVHIRPRTDAIPPLAYDDLIDGVSAGLRKRAGLWRPQTARVAALPLSVVWLTTGLSAAQMWPQRPMRTLVLAAATVLCFAGGFVVARRFADRAGAAILGSAGVAAAILAALDAFAARSVHGAPQVIFVGATAGTVMGLLVAALVFPRAGWRPVAIGLLLVWLLVGAAVTLRLDTSLSWPAIAAIGVVVATALRPIVPPAAFKFAGFTLPDMPAEPEDLQKNIDPRPSAEILAGAATADQFMTALYAVLGFSGGAAMVILAATPGWSAPLAAWLAAAVQILVTRAMTSTWHRLVLAGPAMIALAVWCVRATSTRATVSATLALAFCLVLVAVCTLAARTPARRRFNPIWGRMGDWLHTTAAAALLPVVVVIGGAIELIRAQVG